MQYQQYYDIAHAAAKMFESGDYDGALSNFLSLMESDISDIDKANMCQNIAKVCEKQGRMAEAMEWYDQGVALEHPWCRHLVAEYRAAALAQHGKPAESLAAYEALLRLPWLMESEKDRFRRNVEALRKQVNAA
jgi:hypothetical protein